MFNTVINTLDLLAAILEITAVLIPALVVLDRKLGLKPCSLTCKLLDIDGDEVDDDDDDDEDDGS